MADKSKNFDESFGTEDLKNILSEQFQDRSEDVYDALEKLAEELYSTARIQSGSNEFAAGIAESFEKVLKTEIEKGKINFLNVGLLERQQAAIILSLQKYKALNKNLGEFNSIINRLISMHKKIGKNIPIPTLTEEQQKKFSEAKTSLEAPTSERKKMPFKAERESKEQIKDILAAINTTGTLGKILKLGAHYMFGAEGSEKRAKIASTIAKIQHPKAFAPADIEGLSATSFQKNLAEIFGILKKFGPLLMIIAGVVSAIVNKLLDMSNYLSYVVKSTGFALFNLEKFEEPIRKSTANLKTFGVTIDDISESWGNLAAEFRTVDKINQDMVDTVTLVSKASQMSVKDISRIYRVLNVNWNMTDLSIRRFIGNLRGDAIKYGLSLKNIMEDLVSNADQLTVYFGGSVDRMRKAVIESERLGVSTSKTIGLTKGFSKWGDAIQKSFIVGQLGAKSLNARGLYMSAVFGDVAGVTQQISEYLAEADDSWTQIPAQAEAMAEALSMSVEDLRTLQRNGKIELAIKNDTTLSEFFKDGEMLKYASRNIEKYLVNTHSTIDEYLSKLKTDDGFKNGLIRSTVDLKNSTEKELQDLQNSDIYKNAIKFGQAIGIKDMQTNQDKLLGSIGGFLESILNVLVGDIAPAIRWLSKGISYIFDDGTSGVKSYGDYFKPVNMIKSFMYPSSMWKEPDESPIKETKDFGLQQADPNTMYNFKGRSQSQPDYVAAGPKMFWQDMFGSKDTKQDTSKRDSDIEEIKNNLKRLLKAIEDGTEKPIEVDVYLDGERLAEKIEKFQYKLATR